MILASRQPNFRSALFTAVILFVVGGSAFCDIYKYIDENGVMHFTNVPTASSVGYRVYIRETPDILQTPSEVHPYEELIIAAAETHGIAAALIKAIIKAESNFNPRAVSKKGAMGLMQIMPENLKPLNIRNPFDPKQNIMGGARYFRQMIERFDGKLPLAIAAYNAGPETVARYLRIPPIQETQDYVKRVLKYYYVFKKG